VVVVLGEGKVRLLTGPDVINQCLEFMVGKGIVGSGFACMHVLLIGIQLYWDIKDIHRNAAARSGTMTERESLHPLTLMHHPLVILVGFFVVGCVIVSEGVVLILNMGLRCFALTIPSYPSLSAG